MQKSRKSYFRIWVTSAVLLAFVSFPRAQTVYPDSIKVPVTFYDFHSDGSNPDFEPGLHLGGTIGAAQNLGLHLNEVQTTLDAQRKPILGTTPYFSQRVAKWFRQWTPGDFTVPVYSATGAYLNDATSTTDTAYKNVVIPDSLTFHLVPGTAGVYRINNPNFFVLDGRGFGADDPGGQNPPHNFGFTMELHWEFTYQTGLTFEFSGDDDVWVFINGQRVIDLGGIHGTTTAQVNLDNTPLGMNVGQKYKLDLFYAERHVVGSDIEITTNVISALPATLQLTMNPKVDTLPAGSTAAFTGVVVDDTGGIRHEFDSQILWNLLPTGTSSRLSAAAGGRDTFFARQAYTTYVIGAGYTDNAVTPPIRIQAFDTVYVKPGPDYKVWIEPDANINPAGTTAQMLNRLRNPDHVPLVTISDTQSQATVVGVVRDLYGNFTRFATNALWSDTLPPGLATVSASTPRYTGLIQRISGQVGATHAKVVETGLNFDTTTVNVFSGYIKQLRLVDANTGQVITGININTDQDKNIKVQGILSTDATNTWIDVTGTWSLSPDISSSNPIPTTASGTWDFSPTAPGGPSTLIVTTGTGNHIVNTQISVTVTRAPPSTATFTLITPPASRIAGDTLLAVVTISNHDGLVPGTYCYPDTAGGPAVYRDTLGKGSSSHPDPTITTGEGSTVINSGTGSTPTSECFTNGLDTIKVVLYNAPYTNPLVGIDTLHRLSVNLNGIPASTDPFKLLPGDLYSLQLQNAVGVHLTGTDTLVYPNGGMSIYSVGYDRYGNERGKEPSNWSATQTLHPVSPNSNIPLIFYEASSVVSNESGEIIARAARFFNGVFQDSLAVDSLGIAIKGPPSSLDSAVTRDVNGDGYLDEIELYFNKQITMLPSTNFTITYGNVVFHVDSVGGVAGGAGTGTHFVLYLDENQNNQPQTAWQPLVSIVGMQGASDVTRFMSKDGAGPVIWTVTKTINNPDNRKQDVVLVTFSEPITGPNGSPFAWSTVSPSVVLTVYKADGTGFDTISNALDSILAFAQLVNDSTLEFRMTNGIDITPNNYMNIKALSGLVYDEHGNSPVVNNRKAPVIVLTALPPKITAVPNPSAPTFLHVAAGTLNFVNNPSARDWVKHEHSGTVITFKVSPPTAGETVKGNIIIYDEVGNMVTSANTDQVLASLNYNQSNLQSAYDYDIYWNGSNENGLKVAPGVYRTIVYLSYTSPTRTEQKRLWGTVGISY